MHVLIVDDDSVDREHLKRTLWADDPECTIVEASTVDEGLKLFDADDFDVLLLDYAMPQRDGIEMLLSLRNERLDHSTAIIMMSVSEEEDLALDCLRAGAQDFLPKSDINAVRLHRAILHAQTRFSLESELLVSYQRAKLLAESDSLTGLANRYLFDETLKLAVDSSGKNRLGLMLIDLDHFKYINDHHGHAIGDQLLCKVAVRIQSCLRGNEMFARLGGDEFAITLPNIHGPEVVSQTAQRILWVMQKPFEIENAVINTGASIGLALHGGSSESVNELFRHADIALYRAKRQGRNQFCFFQPEMQAQFSRRYQLEVRLREAQERNELIMHYQPVFDSEQCELIGFEALIRWSMDGRLCSPAEFIPVAEESGLIHGIGRWVINQSIQQLAAWINKSGKPLTMALNISAVQLGEPELAAYLGACLEAHGVPPQQVEVELTETALLDDAEEKMTTIMAIHDLGCAIALDDFGTGFSSISHLRNFPIDILKVDRSLMPPEEDDPKAYALIRGVVLLADALGLTVVGEGAETQAHVELCRRLEIERIQGFYLSKPLDRSAIEARFWPEGE
ncbi:putative bifunctional diguanylate cyclase/phosphodiesterase [Pokkaliibacter sp. CJK22405]|uniref:putative bifunctional diguanylate cyclase/phosphodiesterase n=1 Tax=Pokkaliibacter sp. CJK22405 TaxID=3384615 RepID=UPI003984C528